MMRRVAAEFGAVVYPRELQRDAEAVEELDNAIVEQIHPPPARRLAIEAANAL